MSTLPFYQLPHRYNPRKSLGGCTSHQHRGQPGTGVTQCASKRQLLLLCTLLKHNIELPDHDTARPTHEVSANTSKSSRPSEYATAARRRSARGFRCCSMS